MGTALLLVAAALGAALQRAIGAGYSLVLLPAAVAVLPEGQAVPCVLAVGVLLSGGLLLASRRRLTLDPATRGLLALAPAGQLVALLAPGRCAGRRCGSRPRAPCSRAAPPPWPRGGCGRRGPGARRPGWSGWRSAPPARSRA